MYEKTEMKIRNDFADRFDDWYAKVKGLTFRKVEIDNLIQQIHLDRGLLLDIGCGTGNECRFVSQEIFVGIDISLRSLEILNKKYKGHQVVLAEAKHLPFRCAVFSTALAVETLQHIPEISAAVREAARVLKKNGILAANVYHRRRMPRDEGYWPSGIYYRAFTAKELSKLFLDNGFRKVRISYSNYLSEKQLRLWRFMGRLIDRFLSNLLRDGTYLIVSATEPKSHN